MILTGPAWADLAGSKPRASGDDPTQLSPSVTHLQ